VISCWLGLPVNLFLLFLSSLSSSQTIFLYDIHGLYFNSFLSSLFNFFFFNIQCVPEFRLMVPCWLTGLCFCLVFNVEFGG